MYEHIKMTREDSADFINFQGTLSGICEDDVEMLEKAWLSTLELDPKGRAVFRELIRKFRNHIKEKKA